MIDFMNLPFFSQTELQQLENYQKDLQHYEKDLAMYQGLLEKQTDEQKKEKLKDDIKSTNLKIYTMNSQIQNILNRVALSLKKAIAKRLKEVGQESKEYNLLSQLDNDLKGTLNLEEMMAIYKKYQVTKRKLENRNGSFIQILELKLREIEKKYNSYQGLTNVESVLATDGTIVLKEDCQEYNSICEMIRLLQDKDLEMVKLSEDVYLKESNLETFKKVASKTSFFENLFPKVEEPSLVEQVEDLELAHLSFVTFNPGRENIDSRAQVIRDSMDQETPQKMTIRVPSSDVLEENLSDKKRILNAIDLYVEAKKVGNYRLTLEFRNLIMKNTGIDIDEYLILKKELDSLREDVVKYLSMDEDAYIDMLNGKIKEFQMFIDEGLLPTRETERMELDIQLLMSRIEEAKQQKR